MLKQKVVDYNYKDYITGKATTEEEEDYCDLDYEEFKAKKKKKQQESILKQDEQVIYRNKPATIIFGPYEKNYKQFYEIQTADGKVIAATSTALHRIKKEAS